MKKVFISPIKRRNNFYLQKYITSKKLSLLLFFILFLGGIYLLINILSPAVILHNDANPIFSSVEFTDSGTVSGTTIQSNYINIPKIGVNVEIFEGGVESLEKGAWHRFSEQGNPEIGGNFVITAHRFSIGFTPNQTRARSPFYNLNKLVLGDEIIIIWNNKEYKYVVSNIYKVKPYQTEIENQTPEHRLTLYSCTLGGSKDGREVVEAVLK